MSKNLKRVFLFAALATLALALVLVGQGLAQDGLTPVEELGSFLYFDENLSEPSGQSCASCHDPGFGFADPDRGLPVSEGVILGRFGDRNSPSSAYAMYAPHWDPLEEIGGQFWDGRATGDELGDPLADQALGPFLNLVEMNNLSKAQVIADVAASDYADLFEQVWGEGALDDVEEAYDQVALSIAAFERTELFGQFSSKYDHYLEACLAGGGDRDDCAKGTDVVNDVAITLGKKFFTKKEWAGFQLFMNEANDNDGVLAGGEGAACVLCHVADWIDPAYYEDHDLNVQVPTWSDGMIPPVFTDFTYDNLGVPKNWDNPFLYQSLEFNPEGPDYVDYGLGNRVDGADGMFKVMTLRNIHQTAPYAHNGFFKKLEDITAFYNTRDVLGMWPGPEVSDNVNDEELGNLGLSDKDVEALVKFMKTLTDGWVP